MLESKEFTAYSQGQVIDEGLRNLHLKHLEYRFQVIHLYYVYFLMRMVILH